MAAPERFAESQICSCTAGTVHTWPRLCEKSLGCYDFLKSAGGGDGCQALWKGLTGAKAHFSQPCWTTTWPRTIWIVRLTLSLKVLISPTLAEMDHAWDSDRLGFSPIGTLVSTGGTQSGYVFSMPVYKTWITSRHDRGTAPRPHWFRSWVAEYRQDGRYNHRCKQNSKRARIALLSCLAAAGTICRLTCIARGYARRQLNRRAKLRLLPARIGRETSWLTDSPG